MHDRLDIEPERGLLVETARRIIVPFAGPARMKSAKPLEFKGQWRDQRLDRIARIGRQADRRRRAVTMTANAVRQIGAVFAADRIGHRVELARAQRPWQDAWRWRPDDHAVRYATPVPWIPLQLTALRYRLLSAKFVNNGLASRRRPIFGVRKQRRQCWRGMPGISCNRGGGHR